MRLQAKKTVKPVKKFKISLQPFQKSSQLN